MSEGALTRRGILAATALPLVGAAEARARPIGDRDILLGLLALERRSVLVYEQLVRSGKLSGPAHTAAKLFLGQERRHVAALTQALRNMGVTPPRVPPGDQQPRGDSEGLIRLALGHERKCIRAYYQAHGRLRSPALLATAAGVMANEAQHLAVLRQLLGRDPSPVAFVTGRA